MPTFGVEGGRPVDTMDDKVEPHAPLSLKVRDARKTRGWTQAELATHAGVSRLTVTRLENGRSVSSATLLKVAASLGLRLELHE